MLRARKDAFITAEDLRRWWRVHCPGKFKLAKTDEESSRLWAEHLHAEGMLLIYKAANAPSPEGSGLEDDLFMFAFQTEAQRRDALKYGQSVLFVDGTHNCTHYLNTNLYTIMARDDYGHGECARGALLLSFFLPSSFVAGAINCPRLPPSTFHVTRPR